MRDRQNCDQSFERPQKCIAQEYCEKSISKFLNLLIEPGLILSNQYHAIIDATDQNVDRASTSLYNQSHKAELRRVKNNVSLGIIIIIIAQDITRARRSSREPYYQRLR
ncbi:hypothetical protein P5V15_013878 [Pogonomyrmex californicus]